MAGSIGVRGKGNNVPIPDCPKCGCSLKFEYIGKTIDYINGLKTILDCDRCDGKLVGQSGMNSE